ncbi:MAG: phosphoethanolamine transferase [Weeksellaceae bacterium]
MKKTILLIILLTIFYLIGFVSAYPYLLSDMKAGKAMGSLKSFLEYSLMFVSFILFTALLLKNKFSSILAYLLILVVTLNFAFSISAALIYKSGVNTGMMLSVFDTNVDEVKSMSYMFVLPTILGISFFGFAIFTIMQIKKKIAVNKKTLLFSFVWILLPFAFLMKHKYVSNKGGGSMIKNVFFLSNIAQASFYLNQESKNIKNVKTHYDIEKIGPGVQNIVVIIGESARRDKLSLYGYKYKTTPFAEREKDNMLIFKDAVSPAGITNLSVPLILSTIHPQEFRTHYKNIAFNSIDLANQVDFKTTWISMQGGAKGITSIANFSKNKKWLNGFDSISIPYVKENLRQDGKSFIVLHLNGSHPNPCDRVPETEKNESLDCYDNSIKYTDKLMGELFDYAKNTNTVIIYFSDHGVKISGDKLLHTDSKESTEVPFFIWYSDKVPEEYRKIGVVEEKTQITFTYPLIMRFMGLNEPEHYKNEKLEYLKLDLSTIPYHKLED